MIYDLGSVELKTYENQVIFIPNRIKRVNTHIFGQGLKRMAGLCLQLYIGSLALRFVRLIYYI